MYAPSPSTSAPARTLTSHRTNQMPQTLRGKERPRAFRRRSVTDAGFSPLNPEELKVLRDQYEKEGAFVGVQTKFNYAWVG